MIKFRNKHIELYIICLAKYILIARTRDRLSKFFMSTRVDGERDRVTLRRITLCNHRETLSKAIESLGRNSLRLSRRIATSQSDRQRVIQHDPFLGSENSQLKIHCSMVRSVHDQSYVQVNPSGWLTRVHLKSESICKLQLYNITTYALQSRFRRSKLDLMRCTCICYGSNNRCTQPINAN